MPSFASFQRCVSSLPFAKSYQCLFYDSSYEPYKPSVMMRGLPDEEGFVPNVAKFARQMKPFSLMDVYNQPPSSPLTLRQYIETKF